VIHDIYKRVKESPSDPGEVAKQTAELLTQTAIIHSGYRLEDASHITKSVHELLLRKRNVDVNAAVAEVEVEIPEPEAEDVESEDLEGKVSDDADEAEDAG